MGLKKTLFERVGGAIIIEAAVIGLYKRIMDDPLLHPFFDSSDVIGVMKKQRDFLTFALGGPNIYTGQDLKRVHGSSVSKGLNGHHFDLVKSHLSETLKEIGVRTDFIDEALLIIESSRADVLGKSLSC